MEAHYYKFYTLQVHVVCDLKVGLGKRKMYTINPQVTITIIKVTGRNITGSSNERENRITKILVPQKAEK
jgi:hypothetical protein